MQVISLVVSHVRRDWTSVVYRETTTSFGRRFVARTRMCRARKMTLSSIELVLAAGRAAAVRPRVKIHLSRGKRKSNSASELNNLSTDVVEREGIRSGNNFLLLFSGNPAVQISPRSIDYIGLPASGSQCTEVFTLNLDLHPYIHVLLSLSLPSSRSVCQVTLKNILSPRSDFA